MDAKPHATNTQTKHVMDAKPRATGTQTMHEHKVDKLNYNLGES